MSSTLDNDIQREFLHLFERVGEPLYFSPRGEGSSMTMYTLEDSAIWCGEVAKASRETQRSFQQIDNIRRVRIKRPENLPNLNNISQLCPKTATYNYFNPWHRQAATELREIINRETSTVNMLEMCRACRDDPNMNCKLFVNSVYGCLLTNPRTATSLPLPAPFEVMPDLFLDSNIMREAYRQASMPSDSRTRIEVASPTTGSEMNRENRLSYWREDLQVNSHHWHWHLIYRLEDPQMEGRRKGELFYFMHHSMLARYNAERLGHGLQRTKPLKIDDDNYVISEGYFSKLNDTNSGSNWGTRQSNTELQSLNRQDTNLPQNYRTASLQQLRHWRDRVIEVIDTGFVNAPGPGMNLNIDILGDIIESSALNPNPQFYGDFHNVGHALIAFSHDPESQHLENAGPMNDTTTAMRDPVFYRWHTYVDTMFDTYHMTLEPYQERGGEFPLVWSPIQVTNISVQHLQVGSPPGLLQTFFQKNNVDLARGLDFMRTNQNQIGPIWLTLTHLNHEPFEYTIDVTNNSASNLRATVRIYMAPRFDENGKQFSMSMQRKLFFEMDKFVEELRPGENTITRLSTDSDLTIPWDQSFSEIESELEQEQPTVTQSLCRCGWPQHMLLPRGNPPGQIFDLVVFLTNAGEDQVGVGTTQEHSLANCKESLTFCGRLNEPYPDRMPMGYPFNRNIFTFPNPINPNGTQVPVRILEEYVGRIPNMRAVQVRIVHDTSLRPAPSDPDQALLHTSF